MTPLLVHLTLTAPPPYLPRHATYHPDSAAEQHRVTLARALDVVGTAMERDQPGMGELCDWLIHGPADAERA